ncbi:MAG TPA: type 4a pilus biogenesis protein PilO [Actinomycetota bacterium]
MNPRRQAVIAALGAVLVSVLFFMFALRPKLAQITEVRDEVDQAQTEQRAFEGQLARLREAQEERPRTVARLALANRFVPTDPDLPGFIRQMQAAATAAGVALESIAPSPPRALEGSPDVQVIDVSITIRGGFFRLEDLLIRLESLERMVEVRSLTLSPEVDALSDQISLTTSLSMQMYVAAPDARLGSTGASSGTSSSSSSEETTS